MALNPLSGFLFGLLGATKAAEAGVSTYNARKQREADIAREEKKNAPLDPEDLDTLNRGEIPRNLSRSQQIQLGEKKMSLQSASDKGMVTLTDADIKNYPDFQKQGHVAGNKVPLTHYNQVTKPPTTQSQTALTPEEQKALDKAATRKNNPLPLSLIKTRGPQAKTLAQSLIADENYNPTTAEAGLAAARQGASSAARLEASGPPQILARYANSTKEVLKVAEKASANYPRYGAQFLNAPYNKIKTQTSPQALQFKQVIADLRGHIAAVLAKGYAPQQEQIQEAMQYIPDTITPKQLQEDIPFLNRLIDIQVKGMMTPASANPDANVPTDISEHVKNIFGGP